MHQIALLDDEKLALFIHKRMIQSVYPKAKVNTFLCSNELIDFIITNPSHTLVLSDFHMPKRTGLEVFELFKEKIPTELHHLIKYYLLTSDTTLVEQTKKLNHHMFKGYLIKPLTNDYIKRFEGFFSGSY